MIPADRKVPQVAQVSPNEMIALDFIGTFEKLKNP